MAIKEEIEKLPDSCGVYLLKTKQGSTLYVGKASSLKKRVASYFVDKNVSVKNKILKEEAEKIDYIKCESPEQALILEAALIKEKKPKFNVSLKDGKNYPYVEITREKFSRVFLSRPKSKEGSFFFGPYTDTGLLKKALKVLRQVFPFCSCRLQKKAGRRRNPCLYHHIKLCPGPCAGKITASEYKENIRAIKKVLKGKRFELISTYRKKMEKLSGLQKFEAAGDLYNKIVSLENIYRGRPKPHELIALKESLNLPRLPLLIEAIDISVLRQKDAVGSVVVFKDGFAQKKSYRRFLIKKARNCGDCKQIEEIISRRYLRLVKEKKPLPSLILIDGGRGQLGSAQKILKQLKLDVPVVALAKQNKEVWLPGKNSPKIFFQDSPALHLLERIRDEAHRFAFSYHLIRRRKRWKPDAKG